jgi:hypothetical protein
MVILGAIGFVVEHFKPIFIIFFIFLVFDNVIWPWREKLESIEWSWEKKSMTKVELVLRKEINKIIITR